MNLVKNWLWSKTNELRHFLHYSDTKFSTKDGMTVTKLHSVYQYKQST